MIQQILKSLTPPKKERLPDTIASQIKTLIFSNNVEEGQKLPSERDLADQLEVSRVVVRDALRSLEQSGLIEIRPGSSGGSFVTYNLYKPFFNSIYDLFREGKLTLHHFYEVREAIECYSIKLAVKRVTTEDLHRLQIINKRLIDDIEDKTKLRENNLAFHLAIADISGNPLIKMMVQSLIELLNTLYPQSRQSSEYIRNTFHRHEAIIQALKERDGEQCEKLMAIDTEYTKKLVF